MSLYQLTHKLPLVVCQVASAETEELRRQEQEVKGRLMSTQNKMQRAQKEHDRAKKALASEDERLGETQQKLQALEAKVGRCLLRHACKCMKGWVGCKHVQYQRFVGVLMPQYSTLCADFSF